MNRASKTTKFRLSRHARRIAAFKKRVLAWFRREGRPLPWREKSASEYERVVSEVLLQRTRAETVAAFFAPFIQRFPEWSALAGASEKELRTFLKPIGLWRRKAASLRALASDMHAREGVFPRKREEIELLPGVGQYIANAVLLFAHGQSAPLLDVNMARVLERCFGKRTVVDIRYDPWLQALAAQVVDHRLSKELNWAILDLASKICLLREPRCPNCPLSETCRYSLSRSR